jgi:RNase P subunit RPR2
MTRSGRAPAILPERAFEVKGRVASAAMGSGGAPPTRFRCGACGNLTRFDVVERRRTRAYYHFSIAGELTVEDEEVLEADREVVTCRWCGSSDRIEEVPVEPPG